MHKSIYLGLTIVVVVCFATPYVQADSVKDVDRVFASRSNKARSIPAYLEAAKAALNSRWATASTVKLLTEFIAVGEALEKEDCSDETLKHYDILPNGRKSGYASYEIAHDVIKNKLEFACSAQLHDIEKQLYSGLDLSQVSNLERMRKIVAPIVRRNNFFYGARMDSHDSAYYMSKHTHLLNEMKNGSFDKLKEELLDLFEQTAPGSEVPEAFNQKISRPCKYYTDATSRIFEQQIKYFSDYRGNDDYIDHFLTYQLCRYFEKEKAELLPKLQA